MHIEPFNIAKTCRNCLAAMAMVAAAFSCSPSDNSKKDDGKAYAMLERVAEMNANGDKEGALQLADSAISLTPPDTTLCWLLSEKTVALVDLGRMTEAVDAGRKALEQAVKTADVEAQLNIRGALGVAYRRKGELDSALCEYDKGIELAVREKNTEYEIYLDNCAAVLFCESNRFDEALRYSKKAEKAALAAKDSVEWLSARANIAGVYMKQKKYKDVVRVMMPLWKEVESLDYNVLTLKYLSPLLKAFTELNDSKSLSLYMHYADRAMQGMSATSNGVLGILEIKAAMLGREHRYTEQMMLLDSIAKANIQNHAMPEERLQAERAKCMWHLGMKDDAFSTLAQAYQRLDSVKKSDVERSMNEFAVKYSTLEKEMKIEQMNRRDAEQQSRILWLAVATAVLGIAVCIVAYRKRIAMQRAELESKRSYINGLEDERTRLAKELHDGVCNDMLGVTLLMKTDAETAQCQLKEVWRNARHLSHALMPPHFKYATLPEVVQEYAKTVSNDEDKEVRVNTAGYGRWDLLPQKESYELYRIVQEAVANALKHGKGSMIDISLHADDNGAVAIRIENECGNNQPTDESGTDTGIGMETIKMRAASIGAEVNTAAHDGIYMVEVRK